MRITLGVTGGVAAYKAAELVRRLQQDGYSVQVVMTRGAREFVTPLTFAALSGQKVITDLFGDSSGSEANLESAIEHIAVAQRTDLLVVAPATADVIAKFARGIADDFSDNIVSGIDSAGGGGAGHERQHVEPRGHARECREAARARRKSCGSRRGLPRVWHDRRRTAGGTGSNCRGGARSAETAAGFGRRNGPGNCRPDL